MGDVNATANPATLSGLAVKTTSTFFHRAKTTLD